MTLAINNGRKSVIILGLMLYWNLEANMFDVKIVASKWDTTQVVCFFA